MDSPSVSCLEKTRYLKIFSLLNLNISIQQFYMEQEEYASLSPQKVKKYNEKLIVD